MEIKVLTSGSSGNCYLVASGNHALLLECGIAYKKIQEGVGFLVSQVDGCLISHEHKDHSKAATDVMKTGVEVYASQGTIYALGLSGHRLVTIKPNVQFAVGPSWKILPFEVSHDANEPLGFIIANGGNKLLYVTDTYYLRYRFRGLTHIMIEANYAGDILNEKVENGVLPGPMKRRVLRSHFSLENVKKFFAANDLRLLQEIWLLHLSDGNSDAERFKREVQEATGKIVRVA